MPWSASQWQVIIGCAADICTIVGSCMLAAETVFKEQIVRGRERLGRGIELLLKTGPTKVGGRRVSGPEDAGNAFDRRYSRLARFAVGILIAGFLLQLTNRVFDIRKEFFGSRTGMETPDESGS